jgi:hypothetical protein
MTNPLSSVEALEDWIKRHKIDEPAKSSTLPLLRSNLKELLKIPMNDESLASSREAYRKTVVGQFNIVAGAATPKESK